MRSSILSVCAWCACFVVGVGPAAAGAADAGWSAADSLAGAWAWDTDPRGVIQISRPSSLGDITVAAARFSAVGFFDGGELVALMRTPASGGVPHYGILRLRPRSPMTIDAAFAEELGGAVTRRETWSLQGRFGVTTEPGRPSSPGAGSSESLPRYGDFVYVEELPQAITKVPPSYPEAALKANVAGTVLVQALVGRDGLIKDTIVVKSIPLLDEAAKAAVRQWQFKPAMAKGSPVAVWVAVPVKFTLH